MDLGLGRFENKTKKPSFVDSLQYLFFDKGVTLSEFDELPIPYILAMARVRSYQVEQENKAYKKNKG